MCGWWNKNDPARIDGAIDGHAVATKHTINPEMLPDLAADIAHASYSYSNPHETRKYVKSFINRYHEIKKSLTQEGA